MKTHVRIRQIATAVGLGVGLVIMSALSAGAHVTVSSASAAQGGYTTAIFKVPNESDTASTTKLVVTFPTHNTVASASYQPVYGWKTTVVKGKLATPISVHGESVTEGVTSVTWSATNGGVAPGQFQAFPLSMGPLPMVSAMTFRVAQTYSDGKVVVWDQPTPESGTEPDYPAPVLELAAAHTDGHGSAAASTSATSESQGSSNVVAIAAMVLAAIALIVAVLALARGKRDSSDA
jgi:uncharacterized protein YcnI